MSAAKLAVPATNFLLSSLPPKEYENFLALSKLIELHSGETLSKPGKQVTKVYFPINCCISLVAKIDNHSRLEIGTIGPEGMFGLNLVLGVKNTLLLTTVDISGTVLCMSSNLFLKLYEKSRALQKQLKRYTYIRMNQLYQTAGCNRFHILDHRLCRWILMAQDCTHSSEFHITHECLSNKLGVRRAGITKAAGILQKEKLISYKKGHLKIIDRKRLEALTCECYHSYKKMYNKIMETS